MTEEGFNRLLDRVEKPARYIGGEYNMQVKDQADLRFALCFPDVYEIGMSHLGSRILYHVLNAMDGVRCERCFAPWTDMEQALREAGEELFTLETRSPLKSFHIVGFSLLYEMCYSNILTMLSLARIPFLSRDRGEDYPLIIAGGPCAVNPEPIAPFFDAVVIGDGEEAEPELVNAYRAWRDAGETKQQLLERLAAVPGVYVPSFYEAEYDENGFKAIRRLTDKAPEKVTRRILEDLDAAPFVGDQLVPHGAAGSARPGTSTGPCGNGRRRPCLSRRSGWCPAPGTTRYPSLACPPGTIPTSTTCSPRSWTGWRRSGCPWPCPVCVSTPS